MFGGARRMLALESVAPLTALTATCQEEEVSDNDYDDHDHARREIESQYWSMRCSNSQTLFISIL